MGAPVVPGWTPAPLGGPSVHQLASGWVVLPTGLALAALASVVWALGRRRPGPAPGWASPSPPLPGEAPPASACDGCWGGVGPGDRFCWRCGRALGGPDPGRSRGGGPLTAFGAPLADWGTRVASMVIDGFLLAAPWLLMSLVLGAAESSRRGSGQDVVWRLGGGATAVVYLGALGGGLMYFGVLNGWRRGQTVGNLATGIAVCDAGTGSPAGLGRGGLRWAVRFLLYAMLLVPGVVNDLFPLWDRNRQTIADKVARTVVVKVSG